MKSIRCEFLDWHKPTVINNVGVNTISICSRCERAIMKDSQGNWFVYGAKGAENGNTEKNEGN